MIAHNTNSFCTSKVVMESLGQRFFAACSNRVIFVNISNSRSIREEDRNPIVDLKIVSDLLIQLRHIHSRGFFIDTQSIKNVWTTERKAFFALWGQKVSIARQHDPLKESIIYRRDIRSLSAIFGLYIEKSIFDSSINDERVPDFTDPFLVLVDVAERSDDHKSPFDYSYWSDWFSHLATFENQSDRNKIVAEYWTTSYNKGFGFETSQSRQFWILYDSCMSVQS
jgi:hypothetical protein